MCLGGRRGQKSSPATGPAHPPGTPAGLPQARPALDRAGLGDQVRSWGAARNKLRPGRVSVPLTSLSPALGGCGHCTRQLQPPLQQLPPSVSPALVTPHPESLPDQLVSLSQEGVEGLAGPLPLGSHRRHRKGRHALGATHVAVRGGWGARAQLPSGRKHSWRPQSPACHMFGDYRTSGEMPLSRTLPQSHTGRKSARLPGPSPTQPGGPAAQPVSPARIPSRTPGASPKRTQEEPRHRAHRHPRRSGPGTSAGAVEQDSPQSQCEPHGLIPPTSPN